MAKKSPLLIASPKFAVLAALVVLCSLDLLPFKSDAIGVGINFNGADPVTNARINAGVNAGINGAIALGLAPFAAPLGVGAGLATAAVAAAPAAVALSVAALPFLAVAGTLPLLGGAFLGGGSQRGGGGGGGRRVVIRGRGNGLGGLATLGRGSRGIGRRRRIPRRGRRDTPEEENQDADMVLLNASLYEQESCYYRMLCDVGADQLSAMVLTQPVVLGPNDLPQAQGKDSQVPITEQMLSDAKLVKEFYSSKCQQALPCQNPFWTTL